MMNDTAKTQPENEALKVSEVAEGVGALPRVPRAGGPSGRFSGRSEKGGDRRRGGTRGPRQERAKPEYDQKTLEVRRVARVVAGGRRFSFAVAIVCGDRKGKVGVGTGKASDVAGAIGKAEKDAKKNMITVRMTKTSSILHEVSAKYSSASIVLYPSPNRGLVAGSALRNVLELAGITDVSAKIHSGSKNKLNIARAVVKALTQLRGRPTKSAAS